MTGVFVRAAASLPPRLLGYVRTFLLTLLTVTISEHLDCFTAGQFTGIFWRFVLLWTWREPVEGAGNMPVFPFWMGYRRSTAVRPRLVCRYG